jgi:hypothetical protein
MAIGEAIIRDITKSELDTLISGAGLEEGLQYNITDRGIRLTAISTTKFNPDGLRTMLCPADYAIHEDTYGNNWIGVWNANRTPSEDDLTIWGGLVWKNLTGSVGTKVDDFSLDADNWVVIPKESFTNHEYVSMIFNVNYDIVDDWVVKQWDTKGNEFGMDKTSFKWWWSDTPNLIDACDWNYSSSGNVFFGNKCQFVFNNSCTGNIIMNINYGFIYENSNIDIIENRNRGDIWNNSNTKILNNRNNGSISNNSCLQINNNCNNGVIDNNNFNGNISNNNNNGSINNNIGGTYDISSNINNGNITGTWSSGVNDAPVMKTGT